MILLLGLHFAGVFSGEDEATSSGSNEEGSTAGDRNEGTARRRRGGMDRMKRGGAAALDEGKVSHHSLLANVLLTPCVRTCRCSGNR